MRVVARRRSPCPACVGQDVRAQVVGLGRLVEVGDHAGSRRRAARRRAGTRPGRSRRCAAVTSMRGRPSSASGTTSKPVTRRDASSQTGRQPSSASTSAMSSPWVRIALVPQTVRPTERGYVAGVGEVAGEQRVGQRRADLPRVARRDRLRVDRVEVAPGRQHVDQPARGRARTGRPGRSRRRARAARGPISSVVPASRGTTSVAANSSTRTTSVGCDADGAPTASSTTSGTFSASQPAVSIPATRRRASVSIRSMTSAPVLAGPATIAVSAAGGAAGAPGSASSSFSSSPNAVAMAARRPGSDARPPQIWVARSTASTRSTRCSPAGAPPRTCRPSRICTSLISHR